MLKSLIEQIYLRCKLLRYEIAADNLELNMNDDEIYQYALYELCKTEPMSVENMLAKEGHILDTLDEKMNDLSADMEFLENKITRKFDKMISEMKNIQNEETTSFLRQLTSYSLVSPEVRTKPLISNRSKKLKKIA